MNMKKKQYEVQTNELERYLEDDVEDDSPTFNILTWWKGTQCDVAGFSVVTKPFTTIVETFYNWCCWIFCCC